MPISGHNGEWLGVMGGAWGAFLRTGDTARADEVEAMMHAELDREAQAFQHVRSLRPSTAVDTALLKLAAILTHNVGDVDQGLGYWKEGAFEEKKALYARLAHERGERYGGEFVRAKVSDSLPRLIRWCCFAHQLLIATKHTCSGGVQGTAERRRAPQLPAP